MTTSPEEQVEMKLRAVFAYLPGDEAPTFIGASDAGAWEVIGEDEWQAIVTGWKKTWLADWESYNYREVWITGPLDLSLFATPTLPSKAEVPDAS